MIKLLIVDDSPLMRKLLATLFKAQGDFEVAVARDGAEALSMIGDFEPDVVTLDIQMPVMDGLACLDRIMLERPCPVVMFSSLTEAGAKETLDAIELGAVDFVTKPEGAISLAMDELSPLLIEKIRAAAMVRPRSIVRLAERVRRLAGEAAPGTRSRAVKTRAEAIAGASSGLSERDRAAPRARRSGASLDGIVLVGTSTGGPPALDALLSRLPASFPWPVLVAQHMPSSFTGTLARRLDGLCALTVVEAVRAMPLVPGHVYIGRGDADIIVSSRAGKLIVMAAPALAEHRWHPSVDRLVTTAMQHLDASRLVGVLMTGMGNDGAVAMTQLHAAGGRTIAESEETAVIWGMPGELVKAGGAQAVLPLDAIAGQLLAWSA